MPVIGQPDKAPKGKEIAIAAATAPLIREAIPMADKATTSLIKGAACSRDVEDGDALKGHARKAITVAKERHSERFAAKGVAIKRHADKAQKVAVAETNATTDIG